MMTTLRAAMHRTTRIGRRHRREVQKGIGGTLVMMQGPSDLVETRLRRIRARRLFRLAKWFGLHAGGLHEDDHMVGKTATTARRQYSEGPNVVKVENDKKPNM